MEQAGLFLSMSYVVLFVFCLPVELRVAHTRFPGGLPSKDCPHPDLLSSSKLWQKCIALWYQKFVLLEIWVSKVAYCFIGGIFLPRGERNCQCEAFSSVTQSKCITSHGLLFLTTVKVLFLTQTMFKDLRLMVWFPSHCSLSACKWFLWLSAATCILEAAFL